MYQRQQLVGIQQKIQPCAPCPVLHVEPAIQRRIAQQPRPHGWMVRQVVANGYGRVGWCEMVRLTGRQVPFVPAARNSNNPAQATKERSVGWAVGMSEQRLEETL